MGTSPYLKKFSGTLAATVIFLVLLGGIFLFSGDDKTEYKKKVFPSLRNEEILSIMLKFQNSEIDQDSEINLEKEDGEWFLSESGRKSKADVVNVQRLINDIRAMELIETVSSKGLELGEFGLREPPSEFMLISDKAEYYLLIGNQNPSETGTYVYDVDKDRVLITDNTSASRLIEHGKKDFRDRKVIAISPDLVSRIVLRVGNFYIRLEKKDGLWIAEPLSDNESLDQASVDQLLTVLSDLEINDIVSREPANLKTYGLDVPTAEIEIFQNGASFNMLFGKRKDEDESYIKFDSQDTIYSTSKENFKKLPKNVDDLTLK
jgi:uncharacterized protein DUF4340